MMSLRRPFGGLVSPTLTLKDISITAIHSGDYPHLPPHHALDNFALRKPPEQPAHAGSPPVPRARSFVGGTFVGQCRSRRQRASRAGCKATLTARLGSPRHHRQSQHLALPASVDSNLMSCFNQHLDGLVGEYLPPCLDSLKPHLAKHDEHLQVFLPHEAFWSRTRQTEHHRQKRESQGYARSRPIDVSHCEPLPPAHHPVGPGYRHPPDPPTRLSGTTPAFREVLHQLPCLQPIDLVHCDFKSISAYSSAGVDLSCFRSLNIYVTPDAKINLGSLSRIVKSR